MQYFPFFMHLRGRPVLLVGGGDIATRKARLLVKAGGFRELLVPVHTPVLVVEQIVRLPIISCSLEKHGETSK